MKQAKGPSYVAVITGISGKEGFLSGPGWAFDRADAKVFTDPAVAAQAAQDHIAAHPPVVRRHLKARVEPRT